MELIVYKTSQAWQLFNLYLRFGDWLYHVSNIKVFVYFLITKDRLNSLRKNSEMSLLTAGDALMY